MLHFYSGVCRGNKVMATEFVAYFRVSTDQQGADGLGMSSQHAICTAFAGARGAVIAEMFSDVESGANSERAGLEAAIKNCLSFGRVLLIAKLDRLSRDLHFITGLLKRGVRFMCADDPDASPLVTKFKGLIAEDERERIAARTKAALAVLKSRGIQLGNPRLAETARPVAAAAITAKAHETAARIVPIVERARKAGATTLRAQCEALEALGVKTGRGGVEWHPAALARVLARAA
jgi:DNA invertase Pin-like site-specific DNA recombinase